MQYKVNRSNTPIGKPHGAAFVPNLAGGHGFALDEQTQLKRWLITGSTGNAFYQDSETMTDEGIRLVKSFVDQEKQEELAGMIAHAAQYGVKYHTALLALAVMSRHEKVDKALAVALGKTVIKTASMLYEYLNYYAQLGKGWGSKRNVVHRIIEAFLAQSPGELEYQFLKYRQREGFSARDVLRIGKPAGKLREGKEQLYAWVVDGNIIDTSEFPRIEAFKKMADGDLADTEVIDLVFRANLTHDMIPANVTKSDAIWRALFKDMPSAATLRNLGRLTKSGTFHAASALPLLKSKLLALRYTHPVEFVKSAAAYSKSGMVERKGSLTWDVDHNVIRVLGEVYENLYRSGHSTGHRVAHFIDISSSMTHGSGVLSPVQIAVIGATNYIVRDPGRAFVLGFHGGLQDISHLMNYSLRDLMSLNGDQSVDWGGSTNVGLPFGEITRRKMLFDAIVVWTDMESWQGYHPFEMVKEYRARVNENVKVIYIGMVPYADGMTLADPSDPRQYTIGGFSGDMAKILDMIITGEIT